MEPVTVSEHTSVCFSTKWKYVGTNPDMCMHAFHAKLCLIVIAHIHWYYSSIFFRGNLKNLNNYRGFGSWLTKIKTTRFTHNIIILNNITSARNFLISDANSSHCCVYCHFAVFSDSTICSKCRCFCSSSSFWSSSLLKLKMIYYKLTPRFSARIKIQDMYSQYLASLIASIQFLQSFSVVARSSYWRWFSRRYEIAKQFCWKQNYFII